MKRKLLSLIMSVFTSVSVISARTVSASSSVPQSSEIISETSAGSNSSNSSNADGKGDIEESPSERLEISLEEGEKLAVYYSELIENKKYSEFINESGLTELSDKDLKTGMYQLEKSTGKFQEIISSSLQEFNGRKILRVFSRHEKGTLKFAYTLRDNNHPENYLIVYANPGEETGKVITDIPTSEYSKDTEVNVGETNLTGLISEPKEGIEKKKIIVIMIQGSGPNGMDEKIGNPGNKPFKALAGELNRNGFTTLRYNKRSFQYPELMEKTTVEEEYLKDVKAAAELAEEKYPDYKTVILGHSQGGMLLPVFLKESPSVSAAICLAGSSRSLWDIIYDQNEYMLNFQIGTSKEAKEKTLKEVREQVDKLNSVTDPKEEVSFGNLDGEYVASLNNLKAGEKFKEIKVPILVLQGDKDFQVTLKDFELLKQDLSGNDKAVFSVIEGMNHMLMPTLNKAFTSDYDDPRDISPELVKEITSFLDSLV